MEEEAASLPNDVVAAILCRLPACTLAASRAVCKAWRVIVDERRLLVPYLLPDAVRGIFINYQDHHNPHFFAHPASQEMAGHRINGEFGYIDEERDSSWSRVLDHCNGLLLYRDGGFTGAFYVCNPVTRKWQRLPRGFADDTRWKRHTFLVFDPTVSNHFTVLKAPRELYKMKEHRYQWPWAATEIAEEEEKDAWLSMEWPPSRWTCDEFSSRTGRWKERVFVREGEAAGTAGLLMEPLRYNVEKAWRYSAYWNGALYLHCRGEFVARLSLSNYTYRVIKSPIDRAQCYDINLCTRSFIGKSSNGVCFAAINSRCLLQVWILNETQDGTEEWVLQHQSILEPDVWQRPGEFHEIKYDGPWILDEFDHGNGGRNKVDWSSDDDDI
ncbi:hypothetical protein EJB05_57149, partial [Eragrostis curvula]